MIKIANWGKWQSYRKDRGAPPWIKVYRNIMTCRKWAMLSDSEKGQLISMWIVSADKNGKLPEDGKILKKICQLDSTPNINKFIELGFIDGNMTTSCQPNVAPETETETETDKRQSNIVCPENVSENTWKDFLKHRKAKKAPVTETVLKRIENEACKAGWLLEDALMEICARGWQGFKAEWVKERKENAKSSNISEQARKLLEQGW